MRVHRVFPHLGHGRAGGAGACDVRPVGHGGRLDNPDHYTTRYFAETASGAVAERFGALDEWSAGMFAQSRSGRRLTLATFELSSGPSGCSISTTRRHSWTGACGRRRS